MHTEKRNRNIRLKDLKMIYSRELKERTLKAFEADMATGIIRRPELEERILA